MRVKRVNPTLPYVLGVVLLIRESCHAAAGTPNFTWRSTLSYK